MEFHKSSILSVRQFDRESIETLFALARRMKKIARRAVRCRVLEGYILGSLFFEESTRTRWSSEAAFQRLGGGMINTTDVRFSSMVKGESLEDTARMAGIFCDIIVVRHKEVGSATKVARAAGKPVINAGDGPGEHPTQALLDLFTIMEDRGSIKGATVAMVGDLKHGRTVHSLARLLMLYGVKYIFISPDLVRAPPKIVRELRGNGFAVKETRDFEEGIRKADVVYMTRIQQERFTDPAQLKVVNDGYYRLTARHVSRWCKPTAIIMHPLPRVNEIATDVDRLRQAAYFRQVENGVLVRMALYLLILGKEGKFV
jgi:aspartate carbamoyltransferase catalytic subunit